MSVGALAAACVFEPIASSSRGSDTRFDGGQTRDGAQQLPNGNDALLPDAAGEVADAAQHDSGPDAGGPLRHVSCIAPLPSELPEPPYVGVSASGRPWFDTYRDLSCPDLEKVPTCANDGDCPGSSCLHLASAAGVCRPTIFDVSTLVSSFDGGRCVAKLTFEAQARACCAGLPGFDCREWPYPGDGQPGERCARHQDCQTGLLCKQANLDASHVTVSGLGVCLCPEVGNDPGTDSDDAILTVCE